MINNCECKSWTLQEALKEFAVDFCYEADLLWTWDDFQEFWDEFLEGIEVTILKLSDDFDCYAKFEDDDIFYLVDHEKLKELCMEKVPKEDFRRWLKKNGYSLD